MVFVLAHWLVSSLVIPFIFWAMVIPFELHTYFILTELQYCQRPSALWLMISHLGFPNHCQVQYILSSSDKLLKLFLNSSNLSVQRDAHSTKAHNVPCFLAEISAAIAFNFNVENNIHLPSLLIPCLFCVLCMINDWHFKGQRNTRLCHCFHVVCFSCSSCIPGRFAIVIGF